MSNLIVRVTVDVSNQIKSKEFLFGFLCVLCVCARVTIKCTAIRLILNVCHNLNLLLIKFFFPHTIRTNTNDVINVVKVCYMCVCVC